MIYLAVLIYYAFLSAFLPRAGRILIPGYCSVIVVAMIYPDQTNLLVGFAIALSIPLIISEFLHNVPFK